MKNKKIGIKSRFLKSLGSKEYIFISNVISASIQNNCLKELKTYLTYFSQSKYLEESLRNRGD